MPAIRVELLLEHATLAPGFEGPNHAVLRLVAPMVESKSRPPVDLVACVDVSGSMQGAKLAAARDSLVKLVRELDGRDRLGLVTFSSRAEQAAPVRRMDDLGRQSHTALARQLQVQGNTDMSAGLLLALDTLQESGRPDGAPPAMTRVLLFTDGHANAGLHESDRDGWAELLAARLRGQSVSWVGYGEDHDAPFLSWLADRTNGNAYVARDADAISDVFAQELGGLLAVAARDVRITLRCPDGDVRLVNEEPSAAGPHGLEVTLADLTSEERKDLVVALPPLPGAAGSERRVLEAEVRWLDPVTGAADAVTLTGVTRFVEPHQVQPVPVHVREALVLQLAADALRRATALADRNDVEPACDLLRAMAREADEVGTPRTRELAALFRKLAFEFADRDVYRSSSSRRASIRRSLDKQRSSGSDADGLYETGVQRALRAKFKAAEAAPPADEHPPVAAPTPRPPGRSRRGGSTP